MTRSLLVALAALAAAPSLFAQSPAVPPVPAPASLANPEEQPTPVETVLEAVHRVVPTAVELMLAQAEYKSFQETGRTAATPTTTQFVPAKASALVTPEELPLPIREHVSAEAKPAPELDTPSARKFVAGIVCSANYWIHRAIPVIRFEVVADDGRGRSAFMIHIAR